MRAPVMWGQVLFLLSFQGLNGLETSLRISIKSTVPFATAYQAFGNFSRTTSPFDHCETTLQPPEHSDIPVYVIDLDQPPGKRWQQLIHDKREEVVTLIESIKKNADSYFGRTLFWMVDKFLPLLARTLSAEYNSELIGISEQLGISLGEVTLFNLFYEFFSVCTSVVAEAPDGTMYHGRNLDFGLFLGWDPVNHTWQTTSFLRPLVVQIHFTRAGKTLYRSVTYAGYVGVLTAVKQNKFTLTIDERFKVNGGYVGLAEWVLGMRDQKWIGFLTREVMETCDSFSCAQKMLSLSPLVAPVYFILTGNEPHQGCVITRGRNSFNLWPLNHKQGNGSGGWFMVQTNYDHWKVPPIYDDRRTPAVLCMEKLGRQDIPRTLCNVLSTKPVLNKLTTFTALMSANKDMLHVWLQNCQDPCWPW